MTTSEKTLFLTRFSILLALEAIFCFTPLGSIPIGPMVATTMMIPVIIAGILMGPKAGTAMGAFAGLFSFLVWTFVPPSPLAFVFTPFYSVGEISGNFWSLVIVFVPRILAGTFTGLCFQWMQKRKFTGKKAAFAYGLSGLVGSMTNTVGVLGGIYLFFGRDYASALGMGYELLLGAVGAVVLTNGIPEAILSTVIASVVCQPLRLMMRRPVEESSTYSDWKED